MLLFPKKRPLLCSFISSKWTANILKISYGLILIKTRKPSRDLGEDSEKITIYNSMVNKLAGIKL